ncbi:alpha-glucosidase [Gluconacetobacter azotocaptans]|uniref:alpha-glucosidase n=1 Tax=Gluconacetobacter azotocaptans TaxID=142834 RepID=UPI00195A987F|nr:alpha-glucosidase [Gluconacetobacter azotocaptans]MBM9402440.1 alpha-glucosidase [Gluconacetobacter azotocaptans]
MLKRRSLLGGAAAGAGMIMIGRSGAASDVRPGGARAWWKEAVIYEIYPRSFKDQNGDGIGDIPGIIDKLPYIRDLGADTIWLAPIFQSPNRDNGYDISDYKAIMPEFGTMSDFDRLMARASALGIRIILDLVVNHTSDQHPWFQKSRASKDSPYRDYYIWRDSAHGHPPNNWPSAWGGSAWTFEQSAGSSYLHLFSRYQPDLNWDNPAVREEVFSIMKFWLDKGVSGFRMDAITMISKMPSFRDMSPEELKAPEYVYAAGPHLHDYLREMNDRVLSHYDVMTVGEAYGMRAQDIPLFTDSARRELDMVFAFDIVHVDRQGWRKVAWPLSKLKEIYAAAGRPSSPDSWNTVFLDNHDQPRAVSRFGNDTPPFREASAKAIATMLLTQCGTPFIYQGEELGMTNLPFDGLDDFEDVQVPIEWDAKVKRQGVDPEAFFESLKGLGRDNARSPMQWDTTRNAGFTTAHKPWYRVNPNYTEINAQDCLQKPDSVYHHFRDLIAVRRKYPALVHGAYQDLDPNHSAVFFYSRQLDKSKVLVLINMSDRGFTYESPLLATASLVISNMKHHGVAKGVTWLEPWEARVYAA